MNDTTYWGILCRTCEDLVAFDVAPYPSFGPRAANMKPGAISCGHGHNHIYFPGDFQFLPSELCIGDEVMEQNRAAYGATDPYSPLQAKQAIPQKTEPAQVPPPPPPKKSSHERPASLTADPRRQAAQMAAKSRWAEWALKKVM